MVDFPASHVSFRRGVFNKMATFLTCGHLLPPFISVSDRHQFWTTPAISCGQSFPEITWPSKIPTTVGLFFEANATNRSLKNKNKTLRKSKRLKKLIPTVDGWNPAPPGMCKTWWIMGYLPYQMVQDFSHQQYHSFFRGKLANLTKFNANKKNTSDQPAVDRLFFYKKVKRFFCFNGFVIVWNQVTHAPSPIFVCCKVFKTKSRKGCVGWSRSRASKHLSLPWVTLPYLPSLASLAMLQLCTLKEIPANLSWGCGFNPFQKYARQIGSFPQV